MLVLYNYPNREIMLEVDYDELEQAKQNKADMSALHKVRANENANGTRMRCYRSTRVEVEQREVATSTNMRANGVETAVLLLG